MSDVTDRLTRDHAALTDGLAARRYFDKFRRIVRHLERVAAEMVRDGALTRDDVDVLTFYVAALSQTFDALGHKYLLTGRETGTYFGSLSFDRRESGFPVHRELLVMANDAQQADRHLEALPSERELKERMVRQIVGARELPTKTQFALSQRRYYEALKRGGLFLAQMDARMSGASVVSHSRRSEVTHVFAKAPDS